MCMKGTKCLLSVLVFGISTSAVAEEGVDKKVSLDFGADVVSSYIWRGLDCGGFSAQPSATITWNTPGISLGVWASASLFDSSTFANMSEFDLSLSYSPTETLSIGLTDYHFCCGKYWGGWSFDKSSTHNLELNLSYDFGPMALAWNTCLTGADHKANGDRAYSSYIEATAPFCIAGVNCEAAVGACPWGYHFSVEEGSKFYVMNISCKAEKEIKGIPFFGQVIVNPRAESTYFVVGVSF